MVGPRIQSLFPMSSSLFSSTALAFLLSVSTFISFLHSISDEGYVFYKRKNTMRSLLKTLFCLSLCSLISEGIAHVVELDKRNTTVLAAPIVAEPSEHWYVAKL